MFLSIVIRVVTYSYLSAVSLRLLTIVEWWNDATFDSFVSDFEECDRFAKHTRLGSSFLLLYFCFTRRRNMMTHRKL